MGVASTDVSSIYWLAKNTTVSLFLGCSRYLALPLRAVRTLHTVVYLPILSGCYWLAVPYGMFLKIREQKIIWIPIIGNDRHDDAPKFRPVLAEGGKGPTADTHSGLQSFHQPSSMCQSSSDPASEEGFAWLLTSADRDESIFFSWMQLLELRKSKE